MYQLENKLHREHQEIYQRLESLLHELTKLKNKRDDEHLLRTTKELLEYIKWLLESHFKEEEELLFPEVTNATLVSKLIEDHNDIKEKYHKVLNAYQNFDKSKNYKQELLFPAYNLIATINHHATREDSQLFNQNS